MRVNSVIGYAPEQWLSNLTFAKASLLGLGKKNGDSQAPMGSWFRKCRMGLRKGRSTTHRR